MDFHSNAQEVLEAGSQYSVAGSVAETSRRISQFSGHHVVKDCNSPGPKTGQTRYHVLVYNSPGQNGTDQAIIDRVSSYPDSNMAQSIH